MPKVKREARGVSSRASPGRNPSRSLESFPPWGRPALGHRKMSPFRPLGREPNGPQNKPSPRTDMVYHRPRCPFFPLLRLRARGNAQISLPLRPLGSQPNECHVSLSAPRRQMSGRTTWIGSGYGTGSGNQLVPGARYAECYTASETYWIDLK